MLKPSQSELLCEGIERVYGDTYPIEAFYDANYLRSSMEAGLLHCVAALDSNERVQGCMSTVLESVGGLTADGSALLVAPEYRGQGVVAQLGHHMVHTYQRLGLSGLHLYALGLHDLVQKQSGAAGAVVTGVLPAWFSKRARVAGYEYPDARIGAITLLMPLGGFPERRLYLPEEYAEVLQTLYSRMPFSRQYMPTQSGSLPHACSQVDSDMGVDIGVVNRQRRLLVSKVGEDLAPKLAAQLEQSAQAGEEVVYLDIPLDSPSSGYAVSCAQGLGFFFGALMVERGATDRLRMQRYAKTLAAPEHMVVASSEAKALLDFVLLDQQRSN
ncbi:MAG: GNAT family N-acetyltransferase [Halioglobus sp.]